MVKLGVVSDSHGARFALDAAARHLQGVTHIVHLGDMVSDAEHLARLCDKPVFSVAGNCDFGSSAAREIVQSFGGVKTLLCHGDRYQVKHTLTYLAYRAREAEVSLALYGHTHIPSVEWDGGILLVNPGALRDGRYAVIEFRPNGICPLLYDDANGFGG